jgi:outer membrane autotransporter barrel domain protein
MNKTISDFMDIFLNNPSKENEINLIAELKKTKFIAPVIINQALAKPDGNAVYEEEGSNIRFISLVDDDTQKNFFPVFSNKEEMIKWRKDDEQEVIDLYLKDYITVIENSKNNYEGVVIDAFSYNFKIVYETLRKIYD